MPKDRVLPGLIIGDSSLENSDMMKCIVEQGWEKFFELDIVCCKDLIIAFYRNLKVEITSNQAKLSVKINNVTKVYSSDDFARDFGILNKGNSKYFENTWTDVSDDERVSKVMSFNNGLYPKKWAYPGQGKMVIEKGRTIKKKFVPPHRSCLDGEGYMVLKLVRSGIIPTLNRSLEPSRNELEIFLKLKANVKMNLFMLIAQHMKYSHDSKGQTLPYGMFVTRLMQTWGPLKGKEDPTLRGLILNEEAVTRFGFKLVRSHAMGTRVVKKRGEEARNEEASGTTSSKRGKQKVDMSIDSLRQEMRSSFNVVRKNQGMLAKALNSIMAAISCQGKGDRVDDSSLKKITLVDLEDFEDGEPGQEEDENDGSHEEEENDDDDEDGEDDNDDEDGDDDNDDEDGEDDSSEEGSE